MHNVPSMVISGGQTGADQAGLSVAKNYGIQTGGFAPYDFMTTDGSNPSLKFFGLQETSFGYRERTLLNIEQADCTVIIASNVNSPGTKTAVKHLKKLNKPYTIVCYNPDVSIYDWLYQSDLRRVMQMLDSFEHRPILNVAGNSSKTCPFSHLYSTFFLNLLFELITDV